MMDRALTCCGSESGEGQLVQGQIVRNQGGRLCRAGGATFVGWKWWAASRASTANRKV